MGVPTIGAHRGDFVREYLKVEPYLSLNPSEIVVEERVKVEFENRLERLESQVQEHAMKGTPAGTELS